MLWAGSRLSLTFVSKARNTLNLFGYLVGTQIHGVTRREYDWVLEFAEHSEIQIECLWRLLHFGRIVLTSHDHGQSFGLASPIDAAVTLNSRLVGQTIVSVELTSGSLDLTFVFEDSMALQIIPDSSGYEAWNARTPIALVVAVGGGELTVFQTP